jgi:Creatinine amidohydrolase
LKRCLLARVREYRRPGQARRVPRAGRRWARPLAPGLGRTVDAWEACYDIHLISVDRDLPGWRSQIDHAAKNETALMLALRPDLVDLARLPADRAIWPQGVGGEDPRDATADHGRACIDACLALLAARLQTLGVYAAD